MKKPNFKNEYTIPDSIPAYSKIDTNAKTNWKAKWIWDASNEPNSWMNFRKTIELDSVPNRLIAFISADSKYWLYINNELVVFEGSAKRGAENNSGYYDSVDIAPYLKKGENVIQTLVWYWGKYTNYSYETSGRAGFLFEAEDIISDSSWLVCRNSAYIQDTEYEPNYRLAESNICYDAEKETQNSEWQSATEYDIQGKMYPRGIPLIKDYGLKNYKCITEKSNKLICDIPYNAQITPYIKLKADAGKKIRITTENTSIGAVSSCYITKNGEQEFEALGWFNGEHITYEIPKGVEVIEVKYRETGYDTDFCGNFTCDDEALNTLWQKSLRTLYITMRDNFMDCPDRERAQWWGDVTNEMAMTMYSMDSRSYLLYQKGVFAMLSHIDNETNILQTVVPISNDYFELPVQQLAGICGFWNYYMYTGDKEFIEMVYNASYKYLYLWDIGNNNLVIHRSGSWDWMDWGENADTTALENAWYYYALSDLKNMAELIGKDTSEFTQRLDTIKQGFSALWTYKGYKSDDVKKPDDRANAIAVLSGLADEGKYNTLENLFNETANSSPYMEYYVLDALCKMEKYNTATERMKSRYKKMIIADYSTLWEGWSRKDGTMNHAWSGGPLVIMSKYLAGIQPTKAGYDEFIIKPQYDLSNNISCTVPSVKGFISLNYNSSVINIKLPENAIATVYVPKNSKPDDDRIEFVNSYGNYDVYKMNSNSITTVKFYRN